MRHVEPTRHDTEDDGARARRRRAREAARRRGAAFSLCLAGALALVVPAGGTSADGETRRFVHEPTGARIANPERGFPQRIDPPWPMVDGEYLDGDDMPWGFCGERGNAERYDYERLTPPLDAASLRERRESEHRTLAMARYHLAAFRNTDLPESFLARLDADFAAVREAGVKLVPRFAYNYPNGGPDATLERVERHLDQLRPVLARNEDVLAFMDFGFIGCWGEMHTSSNGLIEIDRRLNARTRRIVAKVFDTVPRTRMVAVRYPDYKFQWFNGRSDEAGSEPIAPLGVDEAYDGSIRARWAQYDDCIACGEWNAGTFLTPFTRAAGTAEPVKTFLTADNEFLVQSGEAGATCCDPLPVPTDEDGDGFLADHDACERVEPLLRRLRYSTFNDEDDPARVRRWRDESCLGRITNRLGYRFVMREAEIPATLAPGAPLEVRLTMRNVGWARPYNPRNLRLVIRRPDGGGATPLEVELPEDVRLFLPGPGRTETMTLSTVLPGTLAAGEHHLFLELADPAPALAGRPEYSIRLANERVWEDVTGLNWIGNLDVE